MSGFNLQLRSARIAEQREKINALRDQLEIAPVLVGIYTVDAHEKADKRMADALDYWNDLGQTTIDWTMADNSVATLTRAELQTLYAGMKRARTIRGLQLHQHARTLKAGLPTLADGWDDPANWPS